MWRVECVERYPHERITVNGGWRMESTWNRQYVSRDWAKTLAH